MKDINEIEYVFKQYEDSENVLSEGEKYILDILRWVVKDDKKMSQLPFNNAGFKGYKPYDYFEAGTACPNCKSEESNECCIIRKMSDYKTTHIKGFICKKCGTVYSSGVLVVE